MQTKSKRRHLRKIRLRKILKFFEMDFEDTTYLLAIICGGLIAYLLYEKGIFAFDTTSVVIMGISALTVAFALAISNICRFLTKEKSPQTTDNHNVGINE